MYVRIFYNKQSYQDMEIDFVATGEEREVSSSFQMS